MSAASEILLRIEDDPVFRGFLESGFDPAAFASTIVKADVGNAAIAAAASAAPGAGPVAAVSLKGDGVGASDHRSVVTSAESVSSQAEVTLDVRLCCISWQSKGPTRTADNSPGPATLSSMSCVEI